MIRHILFDVDGVLNHGEMFSLTLEEKYGIKHEQTKSYYKGIFTKCLRGEADLKETIAPYLKEWGWSKSVDEYLEEWFSYEHVIDQDIIKYVQRLREQGIGCYVATNQEKYRAQFMLERMGFEDSFDNLYASAHLGVGKPEEGFFKKVLKDIEAKSEEVLFWDDTRENVNGAKKVGIHAEFYENFDSFKKIMDEKYEIKV